MLISWSVVCPAKAFDRADSRKKTIPSWLAARLMSALDRLPDGEYHFTDVMEWGVVDLPITVAVTIAGVSEALTLGAKAGVDPAKIVQVLSGGLARCGVLDNRGLRMVRGDFEPGFRIRLHYKDFQKLVEPTVGDFAEKE